MTTEDASGLKVLLRMQRRNYFIGSACLLGGLVMHCVVVRSLDLRLIGSQMLWIAIFMAMGLGLGAGRLSMKYAGVVAAVIAFVAMTSFVVLSGGTRSPYFDTFIALPFILAVFTPDSRAPTLLSGAASAITIITLDLVAGEPTAKIILQMTSFSTFLGLAVLGTRLYRSMLDAQLSAQNERLAALEQLAESERLRGQAERERAEVERLVLVGQLAAGVAHEVNNPLAYVKANLSYLQRETRAGSGVLNASELGDVLDETQQGVLRIQQIITDLSGFSRAGGPEETRGLLAQALPEAQRLASVRLRAGGEVTLELAPELPAVRLGQRHLVQVLLNLLLNAADAVESAVPARNPHIRVSAHPVPDGVRVCVEDNGPGIPEDVLSRLFEPFFTTKPPGKGTGLGLALCRDYVARAGGTLHAENHEHGARFVLLLPEAAPGEDLAAPKTAGDGLPEALLAEATLRDYASLGDSGRP